MNRLIITILVLASSLAQSSDPPIRPINLPSGYDLVGIYRLESKIKVHHGTTLNQITGNLTYKVFSNGKLVRVYNTDLPENFHEYEIYGSEGIGATLDSGATRIAPGLQARDAQTSILKQLSVTAEHLTITNIHPLSDAVTVLYAKRYTK